MCLGNDAMGMVMDSLAPRSDGPIPVTVTLKGDRPLIEGRLTVELMEGNRRLIHFQTEPIAMTSITSERRLLLPAIPPNSILRGQAEWQLTFQNDQERFDKVG